MHSHSVRLPISFTALPEPPLV